MSSSRQLVYRTEAPNTQQQHPLKIDTTNATTSKTSKKQHTKGVEGGATEENNNNYTQHTTQTEAAENGVHPKQVEELLAREQDVSIEIRDTGSMISKLAKEALVQGYSSEEFIDNLRGKLDYLHKMLDMTVKIRAQKDALGLSNEKQNVAAVDASGPSLNRPRRFRKHKKRSTSLLCEDLQPPEKKAREVCITKLSPVEVRTCATCGATQSPEWRRGPGGNKTLCNACGLHYAKLVKQDSCSSPSSSIGSPSSPVASITSHSHHHTTHSGNTHIIQQTQGTSLYSSHIANIGPTYTVEAQQPQLQPTQYQQYIPQQPPPAPPLQQQLHQQIFAGQMTAGAPLPQPPPGVYPVFFTTSQYANQRDQNSARSMAVYSILN